MLKTEYLETAALRLSYDDNPQVSWRHCLFPALWTWHKCINTWVGKKKDEAQRKLRCNYHMKTGISAIDSVAPHPAMLASSHAYLCSEPQGPALGETHPFCPTPHPRQPGEGYGTARGGIWGCKGALKTLPTLEESCTSRWKRKSCWGCTASIPLPPALKVDVMSGAAEAIL